MTAVLVRSLLLAAVGVVVLVWGERRWRSVDRARMALRTGHFQLLDQGKP